MCDLITVTSIKGKLILRTAFFSFKLPFGREITQQTRFQNKNSVKGVLKKKIGGTLQNIFFLQKYLRNWLTSNKFLASESRHKLHS